MIRPAFPAVGGFIAFPGALFGFEATALAVVFLATFGVDVNGEPCAKLSFSANWKQTK